MSSFNVRFYFFRPMLATLQSLEQHSHSSGTFPSGTWDVLLIPLIQCGWAGSGVGKLFKRKGRIILKSAPETGTEDGLKSTKSRSGFFLSFAETVLM